MEPEGKNTAPAIALAALHELNNNRDPILLVLSSDHIIQDKNIFHQSIEVAKLLAKENKLVTFGAKAEKAAELRNADYQLAYAIDILTGLNALGPEK